MTFSSFLQRPALFALAVFSLAPLGRAQKPVPAAVGRVLTAAKVLTAANDEGLPQAINGGCVVIGANGLIEAIGRVGEITTPEGYEEIDLGELWLAPGMVDLHSHIAGTFDINDTVYQVNPGLRVAASVIPGNGALRRALAAGVTTILFIPGSGSNIGGQGVLLKTGLPTFEEMRLRDPGSLKVAQGDNPTRWGYGMRRGMMNFNIRTTFRRGLAYAKAWEKFEAGEAQEKPERDINLDIFRKLRAGETQISTHTQYYQLVMMSILLLKGEFGFPAYVDHGSFDSYRTSPLALEHDVPAILGPRAIMWPRPPRFDTDGQAHGPAWGYQKGGLKDIGFNTDAPVLPQEELPLQ
ncbi:MAG: hypothetical protein AAF368_11380, partial [Planctomycetota bacterium]